MSQRPDLSVLPVEEKEKCLTKLLSHIHIQEDKQHGGSHCWLWGQHDVKGYGRVRLYSKHLRVHRAMYQLLVGEIPEGLQIDHLCRVKICCNPEHLEPVTSRENSLRGFGTSGLNARKECCGRCGGPYYYSSRTGSPYPQRKCRRCLNHDAKIRMANKRAAAKIKTHYEGCWKVHKECAMLAIANGELIKPLGKTVECWKCDKRHRVSFAETVHSDGTRTKSDLAFMKCKGKSYLCGLKGMEWRPN